MSVDMMSEEFVNKLTNVVVSYDTDGAAKAAEDALQAGVDPVVAIEDGLAKGVRIVGDKFGSAEVYLPELMVAVEAMRQALKVLEPAIKESAKARRQSLGKVIIGTIEGDIHDIGKSLVSAMLTVAGFEVVDLGSDVPVEVFIEKTRDIKPQVIGMSALMTTTMLRMQKVIEILEKEGLRKNVKVIVGGAPTSKEWADKIGADGHGGDAMEAVEVMKNLVGSPGHD
jgi:corrinoid protein of di/trimethylamine methyltransferase